MKKVLVTGASGFIGRHAIPFLIESGYEVHAVFHNKQPDTDKNRNLFWHQCNLLNLEEQKQLFSEIKPSHLLHFAWYAVPKKYWTSLENCRWVQASLDLIMDFIENGGKRAVVAGTCAEYDWNYGYCSEKITPTKPSTLYGTCKHSLREMLRHISKQTGLSSAWGRIFFLYGPHEDTTRLVPSVTLSLLKGEYALCSHGNQIRDFLFVNDVASAFVALLNSKVEGVVNIGSGKPITLKSIIQLISQLLGCPEAVKFGAVSEHKNDPPLLVANTTRLTEEVGWKPKYTIEDGLLRTIDWWRKHFKEE